MVEEDQLFMKKTSLLLSVLDEKRLGNGLPFSCLVVKLITDGQLLNMLVIIGG